MDKLEFTRTIKAPRARVWDVLWGDKTYPEWTKPFAMDSIARTDWKEGSEVLFLDGKGSGMISLIRKKIPDEYLSLEMIGMVEEGKEIREGEEVDKWKGGQENYTLRDMNGTTELFVELSSWGMDAGMIDYFKTTWPKALDKLEELATR